MFKIIRYRLEVISYFILLTLYTFSIYYVMIKYLISKDTKKG
jgi:hypothetical protein